MLNTRKENVIKNTVARMPIHAVIPLLHEVGETAFLVLSDKPHLVCLLAGKSPALCYEIGLVVSRDRNCS